MNSQVRQVLRLEEQFHNMSELQLLERAVRVREAVRNGQSEDSVMVEAFACVREAARRVLGMEAYPVQIDAAIAIWTGNIAELATGEGKTLVATMPAYLGALSGKGCHVVTVNDYLAKRDVDQMRPVFHKLGLTCGCVTNDSTPIQRKAAYACDITYVTNHEAGFDYLRDHMAMRPEDVVMRGLNYAIIDEADSVLIDEAQTPLVISGPGKAEENFYKKCDFAVRYMTRGQNIQRLETLDAMTGNVPDETGDYAVDEQDKIIVLTSAGVSKVETIFDIENLSDPANDEIRRGILLALRANFLLKRDQDYVVKDDQVEIVDANTGRILQGRRYSEGLHQAIEAKEGVAIHPESQTLASISFQNFFRKYEKMAGMTGTAMSSKEEFKDVYALETIEIERNRPKIRKDYQNVIFLQQNQKNHATIEVVQRAYEKGQPVLIGTGSVKSSEEISRLLEEAGVPHQVLNAKNDAREAAIIANAGRYRSVTVSTGMAGRGTDIKLDSEALIAGGLLVIGTELGPSVRVDDQLRGRSGRQGNPGASVFYISMEDDLIKRFRDAKIQQLVASARDNDLEDKPLESRKLRNAVLTAQNRIEMQQYAQRKQMFKMDQVIDEQREIVYRLRDEVLATTQIHPYIMNILYNVVDTDYPDDPDARLEAKRRMELKYREKENMLPVLQQFRDLEKYLMLTAIDRNWIRQMTYMEHLQEGIDLWSYAGKDPLVEYRLRGFARFDGMLEKIRRDVLQYMFTVKVEKVSEDVRD